MSSKNANTAAACTIYLGLDVHKDSITMAILPATATAPIRVERVPNDLPKVRRLLARVARDGELPACYEASGAGYVLHRALREWGYACEVIAPSLIPKRPGVQRKHANMTSAMPSNSRGSCAPVNSRRSAFRVRPKSACAISSGAAKRFNASCSSPVTTFSSSSPVVALSIGPGRIGVVGI